MEKLAINAPARRTTIGVRQPTLSAILSAAAASVEFVVIAQVYARGAGICRELPSIPLMQPAQPRAAICSTALAGRGAVLWADSLRVAIDFANAYAAEHLLLIVTAPDEVLALLRNAGTVFVGASASVAFGDYMTGANHVLPTGGLARSYSGLSTLDFVRWTTYQRVTPQAAASLAPDVGNFADAEGLPGHAMAARAWSAGDAA